MILLFVLYLYFNVFACLSFSLNLHSGETKKRLAFEVT